MGDAFLENLIRFEPDGVLVTLGFLRDKPVRLLWGVGEVLQKRLNRDGVTTIGGLRRFPEAELVARYGVIGRRLKHFAMARDDRAVTPSRPVRSISAETTFERDVADVHELKSRLWPLCERVARRLKRAGLSAQGVTLKLKDAEFKVLTRSRRLHAPTRRAAALFDAVLPSLAREAKGRRFRLIGIGAKDFIAEDVAEAPDLFDEAASRREGLDLAVDAIRARFGEKALVTGRTLAPKPRAK